MIQRGKPRISLLLIEAGSLKCKRIEPYAYATAFFGPFFCSREKITPEVGPSQSFRNEQKVNEKPAIIALRRQPALNLAVVISKQDGEWFIAIITDL